MLAADGTSKKLHKLLRKEIPIGYVLLSLRKLDDKMHVFIGSSLFKNSDIVSVLKDAVRIVENLESTPQ